MDRHKIKSVQITGHLPRDTLYYRLCPNNEFSSGTWQMAISTIACEPSVDFSKFITVTSNFCVNQRYNNQSSIENYEQPLATICLNAKAATKVLNRFSFPIWFTINRISDILTLKLIDSFTEEAHQDNLKVAVTLLFHKIT